MNILATGRYLELRAEEGWEYVHRRSATQVAIIVAVTPAHELVLVEQYRPPVLNQVIELPAGLVGDEDQEETVLRAAERELWEETGYRAGSFEAVLAGPTSPGLCSEQVTFTVATDLTQHHPGGGVGGERIQVHCIPVSSVPDWLHEQQQNGLLIDPKIYTGLFLLERLFDED